MFKHSNQLVLDATQEEFLSSACQSSDSSVTVPFFAMPAVALGWISSSISGDFVLHAGLRSVDFSGVEDSAMFILAPELADEVYEALISIGAVPVVPEASNEMRFFNCIRDTASIVLPTFELVLADNHNSVIMRIGLTGEDYMAFDDHSEHLSCRTKFRVRGPADNRDSFVIDPFKLPGINVRSTHNDITFCDAV